MRRNVKNTKCCDENLIEHIKNTIPEIRITEKVVDDGHDVGGGVQGLHGEQRLRLHTWGTCNC